MRTKVLLAFAALALSLAAAGAALAADGGANGRAHLRHYVFVGTLASSPSNGAISISVEGGNRPALRAMLGRSVDQTFAYGGSTEFLQWAKGVPTVVQPGDLAPGTYVRVNVRAPRGASLAQIEQVAAGLVGDHGTELYAPTQPLYLFRGTLASTGDSSVTLDVRSGNARAMRLLLGRSAHRTFTTGAETIFLLWQGKVPTVIDLSQLKPGDRVVVRVRAPRGSSLAQVESTAAKHVGDREPANG
jgi:hypothetical protein